MKKENRNLIIVIILIIGIILLLDYFNVINLGLFSLIGTATQENRQCLCDSNLNCILEQDDLQVLKDYLDGIDITGRIQNIPHSILSCDVNGDNKVDNNDYDLLNEILTNQLNGMKGDLDGDFVIGPGDIVQLQSLISGDMNTLCISKYGMNNCIYRGDLDYDGILGPGDVAKLQSIIASGEISVEVQGKPYSIETIDRTETTFTILAKDKQGNPRVGQPVNFKITTLLNDTTDALLSGRDITGNEEFAIAQEVFEYTNELGLASIGVSTSCNSGRFDINTEMNEGKLGDVILPIVYGTSENYDIAPCPVVSGGGGGGGGSIPSNFCGDKICGNKEDCNTCPKDCGECKLEVKGNWYDKILEFIYKYWLWLLLLLIIIGYYIYKENKK